MSKDRNIKSSKATSNVSIPDDQVDDVILRAAQLQAEKQAAAQSASTSAEELQEMGSELDIDPEFIAEALAEREAGIVAQEEAEADRRRRWQRFRRKCLNVLGSRWFIATVLLMLSYFALKVLFDESGSDGSGEDESPKVAEKSLRPTITPPTPKKLEPVFPRDVAPGIVYARDAEILVDPVEMDAEVKLDAKMPLDASEEPDAIVDQFIEADAAKPKPPKGRLKRRGVAPKISLEGEWRLHSYRVHMNGDTMDVLVTKTALKDRERWEFRKSGRFSHRMSKLFGTSGRYTVEPAVVDWLFTEADDKAFVLHTKNVMTTLGQPPRPHEYFYGTMVGDDLVLHFLGKELKGWARHPQGARFRRIK